MVEKQLEVQTKWQNREKKRNLSDFERGMVIDPRWAHLSISGTAGFMENEKKKLSSRVSIGYKHPGSSLIETALLMSEVRVK